MRFKNFYFNRIKPSIWFETSAFCLAKRGENLKF